MSVQRNREITLLWLVLGVFAAAVINLTVFSARIDLTSAGAWSISAATKATVSTAKEDVHITYYLSKKLSAYNPIFQSLSDFLDEYANASSGKVSVRVVDPTETGEVNDMSRVGILANQMDVVEENQRTQALVYNGIKIEYLDRREVIGWVDQIESLEYELTSRISKLITQKTKTYGFLSADPAKTLESSYKLLSQVLGKSATFRSVTPGEPIGQDVTALIVAGNKGFTEADLKPVDDYLLAGGKLFIAIDGVFVDIANPQMPAQKAGNNVLLKAVEGWGVQVGQSLVLDAYNNVVQFQSSQGVTLRRYPEWPQILPKNTSLTHPVTSRFGGLSLMWLSPLTVVAKPAVQSERLAWTSDKSWLMTDNFTIDPDQSAQTGLLPGPKGTQTAAVALTGTFASAFTAGSVSPATRIIVVGSSNFLTDLMQLTQSQANAVFADTALEWLAQDEALLSIKSRAYRDKTLTLLQDPQVRTNTGFALSFVNLFLVPVLVLGWGLFRLYRRRRREQNS